MKSARGPVLIALTLLAGGIGGWYLVRNAADAATQKSSADSTTARARTAPTQDSLTLSAKASERKPGDSYEEDHEAGDVGAFKHQRTVKFKDKEAMERFLTKAKARGLAVLGSIDSLNTLRIGFLSLADLKGLLDGSEETGFIFPISLPAPTEAGVQPGAVGFGNGLLQWLGVNEDNSSYGAGVRVAILDTGISSTSNLASAYKNVYLVDAPANAADWNGHGTAVADLIHQISPAADLVSYRIAKDDGMSDTWLLSQGILDAMGQGVDVINISFGGGSSAILRDAIEQAQKAGILIFASPGNDGSTDGIAYPAAYAGVIAVGAVDAKGDHLLFSNSGDGVVMSGPGLSLLAQWTGGDEVYFTGTSASSPVALGTLVALMSNNGVKITSAEALSLLEKTLNDSGAPGDDPETGAGNVNLRALDKTPNQFDAAITSNYLSNDASGQQVILVTVQNQGTTALSNATLEVNTGSGVAKTVIPSLAVNGISTFSVPVPPGTDLSMIQSTVQISGGLKDRNPSNNVRSNVSNAPVTPAK